MRLKHMTHEMPTLPSREKQLKISQFPDLHNSATLLINLLTQSFIPFTGPSLFNISLYIPLSLFLPNYIPHAEVGFAKT